MRKKTLKVNFSSIFIVSPQLEEECSQKLLQLVVSVLRSSLQFIPPMSLNDVCRLVQPVWSVDHMHSRTAVNASGHICRR